MKTTLLFLAITVSLMTGCVAPRDPHRTGDQIIEDGQITRHVRASLDASPVFKFSHVQVFTYDGLTQLSGFVLKESQRAEAVSLASSVPGVTEIINNISLTAGSSSSALADATGRATYGPHR